MDDLRRMAVFASVVRLGSMSAAARELDMSTSAVSQQVRQLERDGAVTLLHRSTRRLAPTEAGERFYERCAALAEAAAGARAELRASRETPSGELRLSATVGFAQHVAPALGPLLEQYAGLRLHLLVDDAQVDLIEARVDLAVRYGRLPDSSWSARRLGAFDTLLCAAPAWIDRHPAPRRPEDLLDQQWLALGRNTSGLRLAPTGPDGAHRELRVEPRIVSNNQLSLQQMCVAGLGLALLGSHDVQEDLKSRRLVVLLPDWRWPSLDIWAVTPQRDAQPAKVRHAVLALQEYLRGLAGVNA